MSAHVKKSIIENLIIIGTNSEASIKKNQAMKLFGDDYQNVLDSNLLVHFKNLMDIEVFDGEYEYTTEIQRKDGKNMYFSVADGWVPVLDEDISLFKVNFERLIRHIMKVLDIADRHEPKVVLEDSIWVLGQHRIDRQNIHIIIVRNIRQNSVLDSLYQYLNDNHKSRDPALIISLDQYIPKHLNIPGQNRLIRLEEAMVIEGDNFDLNTRLLAGKMGGNLSQDGFSSGYRNLVLNGNEYKFTKKQAEAIEFMYNAGAPRHQDEILAEINSSQTKLLQVFRSVGKTNSAWGEVIKSDGKGNYYLDI